MRNSSVGGAGQCDERHADADDGTHPLGVQPGQIPHDQRPPVVADEHGVVLADVVEQPEEVVGELA